MPFTPYHMGPAFPVKGILGGSFSLLLYGYTQFLIDLEALYHILNNDEYLHGFPHSFLGASLIGCFALLTGKPLFEFWLRSWNKFRNRLSLKPFDFGEKISWKCGVLSVWIGSWLHILLDAYMHHDMFPFVPFSKENPFLALVDVRTLHIFCAGTAVLGLFLCGWRAYAQRGNRGPIL